MTRPPVDFEIDETPPRPRAPIAFARVLLFLICLFWFLIGYAMGDEPMYEPEPRFQMCQGSC